MAPMAPAAFLTVLVMALAASSQSLPQAAAPAPSDSRISEQHPPQPPLHPCLHDSTIDLHLQAL